MSLGREPRRGHFTLSTCHIEWFPLFRCCSLRVPNPCHTLLSSLRPYLHTRDQAVTMHLVHAMLRHSFIHTAPACLFAASPRSTHTPRKARHIAKRLGAEENARPFASRIHSLALQSHPLLGTYVPPPRSFSPSRLLHPTHALRADLPSISSFLHPSPTFAFANYTYTLYLSIHGAIRGGGWMDRGPTPRRWVGGGAAPSERAPPVA
jgi:hypothetical protein